MVNENQPPSPAPSVSARVFAAFVDAVAEQPDLSEVAERLRDGLLVRNDVSESSLRDALFGSDQP